jgi:hypothetical protein
MKGVQIFIHPMDLVFDTVICSKNINFVDTIFPVNHDLFLSIMALYSEH